MNNRKGRKEGSKEGNEYEILVPNGQLSSIYLTSYIKEDPQKRGILKVLTKKKKGEIKIDLFITLYLDGEKGYNNV